MTSERQAYIYVQLPGTLTTVPAALLKVERLRDGTFVGRFRYGDRLGIVEPHDYGVRKGVVKLFAYQVDGESNSDKLPEWRMFASVSRRPFGRRP